MASFEGAIGTPAGGYNLKVEYGYSQSISGNYSDVWATGYLKRNKSSYWAYNYESSASLSINGNTAGYSGAYDMRSDGYKTIMSHSVRVYHNNSGQATIPISFSFNGLLSSYYPLGTISQNITLPTIPRQATVTSATNFNDEGNPTIKYSNPGGLRINARLEFGGSIIRRDNISNTGSYTFSLTSAERDLLRSKCPNSNSLTVREVIATCVSGTTESYWSWQDKTMSIVNANPTFSNFQFEDINDTTVALTGNNQKVIKNYSNVKVTIPEICKATANKYATMSKYSFACNDTQRDITYSSSSDTSNSIDKVKSGVFNVYAIDSRNNSTLVTKNAIETINYNPLLKGNITIVRSNGTSELSTLSFSGTIDLVNFGVVTNSIKEAKFRYKQTDMADWSEYTDLTLTIDENGNFSYSDLILGDTSSGFNIDHSYNIEVYIKDELSDITFTAILGSGTPNISLHKQGVGIMGKYDTNLGGSLQVDSGIVPSIVESGTSGIWTYRKWSDGVGECWGKSIFTGNNQVWGSLYSSSGTTGNIDYPFTFKEIPMEVAMISYSTSNACWLYKESAISNSNSTTHSANYRPIKVNSFSDNQTFYVSIMVKGKWK